VRATSRRPRPRRLAPRRKTGALSFFWGAGRTMRAAARRWSWVDFRAPGPSTRVRKKRTSAAACNSSFRDGWLGARGGASWVLAQEEHMRNLVVYASFAVGLSNLACGSTTSTSSSGTEPDASSTDAGLWDASVLDAGLSDVSVLDAGSAETGSLDARECGQGDAACLYASDCCSNACNQGRCDSCPGEGSACETGGTGCCPSFSCYRGTCKSCKPSGQPCQTYSDCCSGYCDNNVCKSTCGEPKTSCSTTVHCCAGETCSPSQTCCTQTAQGCSNSAECCSGTCVNSVCACAPNGGQCAAASDCCTSGIGCDRGVCCNSVGATCTTYQDCCNGMECGSNHECCIAYGPCLDSTSCCSGKCSPTGYCMQ
jgi:hypothetical protein